MKIEQLNSISEYRDDDPTPGFEAVSYTKEDKPAPDTSVITKLTPGVHDPSRVNIFVNGRFDFSLNVAQVVDLGIKIGKRVTAKQLKEYRKASEFGKLYQNTLEWVLMRPRSIHETRQHLKNKLKKREITNKRIVAERKKARDAEYYDRPMQVFQQNDKNIYDDDNGFFSNAPRYKRQKLPTKELPLFTEEDMEAVITRLKERKYLDDERFARYFLENRNAVKGASLMKLRLDLTKKGIDKKLIDQLMTEDIRSDNEEIKKIIAKKAKKYNKSQLIAYLVRHGFGYQLAQDAVAEMDSQNPE